jgi:hypothetical protein
LFVQISDESLPDPFYVFEYDGDLLTPNLRHDEFDAAIAKIAKQLSNNQLRVGLSIEVVSNPSIAEQRLELIRQRLVALGLDVERISAVVI